MLARAKRITSREFAQLRSGVTVRTPLFNAKKYKGPAKLAIIISKKNIKKSNKRNALRRKICYAYRTELAKSNTHTDTGTVVINYINRDNTGALPDYKLIQQQIQSICGIQ